MSCCLIDFSLYIKPFYYIHINIIIKASKMPSTKCFPYRPYDYMYDPIFNVSGPIDHYKAAIVAKMSSVKFQICPIFSNMFSELPNHPRVQLVQRRTRPMAPYREKKTTPADPALQKTVDVLGADRLKFFCPVVNFPPSDAFPKTIPTFTIEKVKQKPVYKKDQIPEDGKIKKDVQVETQFRESEAQTIPWEPPYVIVGEGEPEILKLSFLKWGSGLPAGMHEIRLIERARMKRAWEKTINPRMNKDTLVQFSEYVEALEMDEWAFREEEINEIHELRMQLLEKMLEEIHELSKTRSEKILTKFISRREAEKEEKLEKIRKEAAREMRKLESKRRGLDPKYKPVNIIEEHINKKSEIYGPLMRHGEHPKRWHHIIDEKMQKYRAQFIGVEQFSTLPRWLDQATKIREFENVQSKGTKLCIRETKWTSPILKQLHDELKNLRKETVKHTCTLRIKNEQKAMESFTPEMEGVPKWQENQYQAAVHLQKLIKGRATQMTIYEGRDNCKELIQELKNSVGLLKKQKEGKTKEKLKVRMQQREETVQMTMVQRLQGTLGKLQGSVVGTLLDFLNKELRRLLEERKAHAMCWINDRERNIREAAEAGRRQKELRRRREHDEMFKQMIKVTQDSVDLYLQDIVTEGMEFSSQEQAMEYVKKLADKIERESLEAAKVYDDDIDEQDEEIANLVHHFVLPEIEKRNTREQIRKRQKEHLKAIHDEIYSQMENLPKPVLSEVQQTHIESERQTTSSVTSSFKEDLKERILTQFEMNLQQYTAEEYTPDYLETYLNNLAKEQDLDEQQGQYFQVDNNQSFDMHFDKRELETIVEVESVSSSKSGEHAEHGENLQPQSSDL